MHTLPKLPYSFNALEPAIDAKTMEIHHGKHHQAYIDKLNKALENHKELQKKSAEELLSNINALPKEIKTQVRSHGGGHANHSFFWKILRAPQKNNTPNPNSKISKAINENFQSFDEFKEKFTDAALTRFGSGWAWLVQDADGKLEITSTSNQDSPISEGKKPILGLDVWEHSYYVKYMWNRPAYIEAFFTIINWTQVEENYQKANQ